MKNPYKEFLKKKEIKDATNENVVLNEQSTFTKVLLFIFDIFSKIFKIVYYVIIIALCSVGATYIANKYGIIHLF